MAPGEEANHAEVDRPGPQRNPPVSKRRPATEKNRRERHPDRRINPLERPTLADPPVCRSDGHGQTEQRGKSQRECVVPGDIGKTDRAKFHRPLPAAFWDDGHPNRFCPDNGAGDQVKRFMKDDANEYECGKDPKTAAVPAHEQRQAYRRDHYPSHHPVRDRPMRDERVSRTPPRPSGDFHPVGRTRSPDTAAGQKQELSGRKDVSRQIDRSGCDQHAHGKVRPFRTHSVAHNLYLHTNA
jgi:hypothetical protein